MWVPVSDSVVDCLNAPRLMFELQRANQIAQDIYACLDTRAIANRVTQGLVNQFNCALARIWLVEPDRTHLKMIGSAGLYTRTDGAFSTVPMGAFKVGKIAQNRVSFLSNNLLDEPWLRDREWALQHQLRGFAGYPLATSDTVIGVLAVFSREALAPEFLEILLSLCTTVTVSLGSALQFQQVQQTWHLAGQGLSALQSPMLSDYLAKLLGLIPLKLVGTERSLDASLTYLFIKFTELVQPLDCTTCSLTYSTDVVTLDAIVSADALVVTTHDGDIPLSSDAGSTQRDQPGNTTAVPSSFRPILLAIASLGGTLTTTVGTLSKVVQITLKLPYSQPATNGYVRVECRSAVLQCAFSQMVTTAGFALSTVPDPSIPLITDQPDQIQGSDRVIWVHPSSMGSPRYPQGVVAQISLDTDSTVLREVILTVLEGNTWGIHDGENTQKMLSSREHDVMCLLTQGLRDREIAGQLHISESTVKFHINNTLAKLNVKTRVQAVYELMRHGWLEV